MTPSARIGCGIALVLVAGMGLLLFGIILSSTGIGLCLGVPMILLAIPVYAWGGMWVYRGRAELQRQTIARGIQQGITAARAQGDLPSVPPSIVDREEGL